MGDDDKINFYDSILQEQMRGIVIEFLHQNSRKCINYDEKFLLFSIKSKIRVFVINT